MDIFRLVIASLHALIAFAAILALYGVLPLDPTLSASLIALHNSLSASRGIASARPPDPD